MKRRTIITGIMTVAILTGLTVFALTHKNNTAPNNDNDKEVLLADISEINNDTETIGTEITSDTVAEEKEKGIKSLTDKILYQQAFEEMTKMLTGQTPITLKRAEFLTKNAFHNGKLNF